MVMSGLDFVRRRPLRPRLLRPVVGRRSRWRSRRPRRAAARTMAARRWRRRRFTLSKTAGLARQPARGDLPVRGRAGRDVRRRLPRLRPLPGLRRRADVDRRSRSAAADADVEAGRDDRVHAHGVRAQLSVQRPGQRCAWGSIRRKDGARATLAAKDRGLTGLRGGRLRAAAAVARTSSSSSRTAGTRPRTRRTTAPSSWQWTGRPATIAFRNPKRDVWFYLHLDGRPDLLPVKPQTVTVAHRSTRWSISSFWPTSEPVIAQGGHPGGARSARPTRWS